MGNYCCRLRFDENRAVSVTLKRHMRVSYCVNFKQKARGMLAMLTLLATDRLKHATKRHLMSKEL